MERSSKARPRPSAAGAAIPGPGRSRTAATSTPTPYSLVGPDNFSDVFTGQINITTGSTTGVASTYYTFGANTDDDGYMYVDDKLVSAYPGGHGAGGAYKSYPIPLTAGAHDVQFFESNGGGGWAWNWLYAGPDTGTTTLAAIPFTLTSSAASNTVAPSSFTVAATPNDSTRATVTWSISNNTSAIRYVVQRSTDSTFNTGVKSVDVGLPSTLANAASFPTTDSYVDTGLTFNTQYYYRILVENYDSIATSATQTIMTANQYPANPSVVATQDVNGNIQVSFPAQTFAGITGYQLLRSVNGGTPVAVAGSPYAQGAGPYFFTDPAAGLTAGSTYQYSVITTGTGTPANSPPALSDPIYYVTNTIVNHATGFTGETDLTLNTVTTYTPPSPIVTATGTLQITDNNAGGNEANTAFTTTPVAIDSDFSTSFDFNIANPGADGLAFVIQAAGNTAIGTAGGGYGYTGISPSLAVIFNQYNGVTQTQLGINGGLIGNPIDMSTTLGNAFHNVNASSQTDTFQVSLNYQASTQTLVEAVRDTTTGLGFTTSYNLASYGLSSQFLLGAGSGNDFVGFTGGTGGAFSNQFVTDWVFNDTNTALLAAQPGIVGAGEDVNGNIQVDFPAPPVNGFTNTTYQLMRSVNGGTYAPIGSPIAYNAAATEYTYIDPAAGLSSGSTYTYEAVVAGTTPANPATSAPVFYLLNPLVAHTPTTTPFVPTTSPGVSAEPDLQFNGGMGSQGAPAAKDGAMVDAQNQLQLTDSQNSEANSVFTTNPVQIKNSWETTFDYQITNPNADGLTFVVQNIGNTALGGGGGSLGYQGGSFASASTLTNIAFALNMYNGVTQTAIAANGTLAPYVDMSGSLGNDFHVTPTNSTTHDFQVSLAYNATNGNFYETVLDTANGKSFSQTITPAIYGAALGLSPAAAQAAVTGLFASPDYVGFTAGTGGANSTQSVNDWVFNTASAVVAPTLVGNPVVNGDNPNGLFNAAGQPAFGTQRSMVEDVVYTFSSGVSIPNAAAAFTVVPTGAHPGTAPVSLTATAVAGTGGTQWAVTLTGKAPGVLASIANGEYSITINPAGVFAAADGTTQLVTGRTDQFYRLYGDINAKEVVNALDNLALKKAIATYNPAFDSNGDGAVNALDNLAFKKDLIIAYFGDGFVPTI